MLQAQALAVLLCVTADTVDDRLPVVIHSSWFVSSKLCTLGTSRTSRAEFSGASLSESLASRDI